MRKKPGTTIAIPGFDDPRIVGLIFRYYLYASKQGTTTNEGIEAIYQKQGTNLAVQQLVGTIAPLYEHEHLFTAPAGRLMVSNPTQIPTPAGTKNNGNKGFIALAPAMLSVKGNLVSADFSGTFPDYYQAGANPQNPKFDFGPISLKVTDGTASATISQVDYADTDAGNQRGWVFDYDVSSNKEAQAILASPDAVFKLVSPAYGDVLVETDYYFVTDQQAIYGEQFGSGTEFLNQGIKEPARVSVFHRGRELPADACPAITVWQYRSVPLQAPGDAEPILRDYKPGEPIRVDTSEPGNFLFTVHGRGRRPAAHELQHLHEPAVYHQLAADQPAPPAERRGLQPVLCGPHRRGHAREPSWLSYSPGCCSASLRPRSSRGHHVDFVRVCTTPPASNSGETAAERSSPSKF